MNSETMHSGITHGAIRHGAIRQSKTTHSESRIEKFIVFIVAEYHLALPVGAVLQVVTRPPTNSELDKAGLVQVGRHVVQQLDLHRHLGASAHQSEARPFFVITHNWQGGLWAIPVNEPPNLAEFSLELLRSLPPPDPSHQYPDEHQSNILSIASHAATMTQDDRTTTVFLINLKRLSAPIKALG
jgi:hypothetical protein